MSEGPSSSLGEKGCLGDPATCRQQLTPLLLCLGRVWEAACALEHTRSGTFPCGPRLPGCWLHCRPNLQVTTRTGSCLTPGRTFIKWRRQQPTGTSCCLLVILTNGATGNAASWGRKLRPGAPWSSGARSVNSNAACAQVLGGPQGSHPPLNCTPAGGAISSMTDRHSTNPNTTLKI